MKLTDWLTRSKAALDKTPINTTAGESTSLLTQTAGAVFGLMPALMTKTAGAMSAQHMSRDGAASASDGDHAAALGGTDFAHTSEGMGGTSLGQAVPAAAIQDGHGAAQVAPHVTQNEQSAGSEHADGGHGAIGSSAAPQPLHLPDTSHDFAQAPSSSGGPASDLHSQSEAVQADPAPSSFMHGTAIDGAMIDMATAGGRASLLHIDGSVSNGVSHAVHGAVDALHGAVASVSDTVHGTISALQTDVSEPVAHLTDSAGQTLSGADQIVGSATHLASSGDAGLGSGTLTHDANNLLDTTAHSALNTVSQAAAPVSHAGGGASNSASLLHASTEAPHADAPTSSVAALPQSLSDIGHAASQTTDGSPLHIPLIGQSYMDHDVGHDAGFSLHALHGI